MKIKLFLLYTVVISAWLLATLVTSGLVFKLVVQKAEATFNQRFEQLYDSIEHTARDNEAILEGFSAFLSAVEYVDRDSTARYARQILAHYPHVYRLEVVLSVKSNELRSFTARQRNTWFRGFKVQPVQFGPANPVPDGKKQSIYHPIIFVEPDLPNNKKMIGVNLESASFLRKALHQSKQTQSSISTIPFGLVDGPRGYALIRPVPSPPKRVIKKLKQAYVMLEVDADIMTRRINTLVNDLEFNLYHANYAKDNSDGVLIYRPAQPFHRLEAQYLPKLTAEKKLSRPGQPYVLRIVKQMTWSDFNVPLVIILACASFLALIFILMLLSSYFKREKQRRQSEDRLLHMATHDALTGLPNRTLLTDRFKQAINRALRHGTQFSVMFIDLNDFKRVNDTYGHDVGDQLLKTLGSLLHDCIRQEDTLCRISGDEFVILLEDTPCPNAERVSWKIHDITLKDVTVQGIDLKLSLSLGIATYPEDGQSMSELLRKADERMYMAKLQSKSECYSPQA